jgi:hypothetical protein
MPAVDLYIQHVLQDKKATNDRTSIYIKQVHMPASTSTESLREEKSIRGKEHIHKAGAHGWGR